MAIDNLSKRSVNSEKLVKLWRANPDIAAQDILNVELDIPQKIIMRQRWQHDTHYDLMGRGLGKCIDPASLVISNRGLMTLDELRPSDDVPPGECAEIDVEVVGTHGPTRASGWYNDGVQDGYTLRSEAGFHTSGTDRHRVLCWVDGHMVHRHLQDIQVGDWLVIPRGQRLFGDCVSIPMHAPVTTLDDDLAYMIGQGQCRAYGKQMPLCVRQAPEPIVRAFLQGLFDTDGRVDAASGSVGLSSVSEVLVDQVQVMLTNFGVISRRHFKDVGTLGAWHLTISSADVDVFRERVGFRLKQKADRLEQVVSKRNPNKDVVPDVGPYFDQVASKEPWRGKAVDLVVPDGHEFCANGMMQHNTFLTAVDSLLRAFLWPGNQVGIIAPSFRQCPFVDLPHLPIFTSRGMTTTPQMFYDTIRVGDQVASVRSHNHVMNKWLSPARDGYIIDTERGFTIGGIKAHQVLVAGDNLSVDYKSLDDLRVGDLVAIKRGSLLFGDRVQLPAHAPQLRWTSNDCRIPTELNTDLAYWIGLMTGDGYVTHNNETGRYRATFTNCDNDLIEAFRTIAREQFGLEAIEDGNEDRNARQWTLNNKKLTGWLTGLGMANRLAPKKQTPTPILMAPQSMVAAYLSGLLDTDGGGHTQTMIGGRPTHSYTCGLSTSSPWLAHESRAMLLNFGILATLTPDQPAGHRKLTGRDKTSDCSESFKVRFTSRPDIRRFSDLIGYRCLRKRAELAAYLVTADDRCNNSDMIPRCATIARTLARQIHAVTTRGHAARKLVQYICNKALTVSHFGRDKIEELLNVADDLGVVSDAADRLRDFLSQDLAFVAVTEKTPHRAATFDIEVDHEHCYVAGGFVNHNSKFAWEALTGIWQKSDMLQRYTIDHPKTTPEKCYLKFQPAPGHSSSFIDALPLGMDGAKIRGARYFHAFAEEAAQIESEVLDVVVRGFMATNKDPMENVRRRAHIKEMVAKGLADPSELLNERANKLVYSSTAFYQFNHLWERVSKVIDLVEKEKRQLTRQNKSTSHIIMEGGGHNGGQLPARVISNGRMGICAFNAMDASDGFLNMKSIRAAREEMSEYQWLMEYMLLFPADSEGFFRRSLIEGARKHGTFGPIMRPREGMEYVLGIDPARSGDNFTIALFEVDQRDTLIRMAQVWAYNKEPFPKMHLILRQIIHAFNVKYFQMDAGGGGTTMRDLLADRTNVPIGQKPILERGFDGHRGMTGSALLGPLVQFSSADWVQNANFTLRQGLESGRLLIPCNEVSGEIWTPDIGKAEQEIEDTITEMSSIITLPVGGRVRWDTPTRRQKKDRYSAVLVGYDAACQVLNKSVAGTTLAMGYWK
jgi:intein/homing endonuclease